MMLKAFQSVDNEQGKTAVIFFVSMAVLAFLLHPKTSPFAEHYYNFKAETQLTQLYDSCTLVWAAGGQHNTSSANKGKQGSATECDLATAVLSPYNFIHDKNVVVEIKDGTESGFSATAKHKEGTSAVGINADGEKVS
jgi:hypothetical protein